MQRVPNYGSFLQAFALKRIIEELGHEVIFLDFHAPVRLPFKSLYQKVKRAGELLNRKRRLVRSSYLAFVQSYNEKYLQMLGIDAEMRYGTPVDVLVVGSDEVFNCLQDDSGIGYSSELFGANQNADKILSYAASFGHTTLDGLRQNDMDKEIGRMLAKFSAVSVRDDNSAGIVRALTHHQPAYHPDPVFIYDFSQYLPKTVPLKNYMLVYAYSGRIRPAEAAAIRAFAGKHSKKVISVGVYHEFCDVYVADATPFELLAYVKNADYVVTDTFHGTVFSIKFNKRFVTIVRESNQQKLGDLLDRFHLSEHSLRDPEDMEAILQCKRDFSYSNQVVAEQTQAALDYLRSGIGARRSEN